jgi:hypothetical protein
MYRCLWAILFCVNAFSADGFSEPEAALLKYVVPGFRFQRLPIPDDQNAFVKWHKAAMELVLPDEEEKKVFDLACGNEFNSLPTGDDLKLLHRWLQKNDTALKLFEEGSQRPRCRFPGSPEGPTVTPEPSNNIRILFRIIIAHAKLASVNGDETKTLYNLLIASKIADTICESEGGLHDHSLGLMCQLILDHAVRWVARQPNVSEEFLSKLLKHISAIPKDVGIKTALENDFINFYIVATATLSDNPSALDLKRFQSLIYGTNDDAAAAFLAMHPKVIDKPATIRQASTFYLKFIENARRNWIDRKNDVHDEHSKFKEVFMNEWYTTLKPLMKPKTEIAAVDRQLAIEAITKVDNPCGRMMISLLIPVNQLEVNSAFRVSVDRDVTRTIVALHRHKIAEGKYPEVLQGLVQLNYLPAVPIDAYSGKPLLYSRDRRLIWSTGEDSKDDGGAGNSKTHFEGTDFVWEF